MVSTSSSGGPRRHQVDARHARDLPQALDLLRGQANAFLFRIGRLRHALHDFLRHHGAVQMVPHAPVR